MVPAQPLSGPVWVPLNSAPHSGRDLEICLSELGSSDQKQVGPALETRDRVEQRRRPLPVARRTFRHAPVGDRLRDRVILRLGGGDGFRHADRRPPYSRGCSRSAVRRGTGLVRGLVGCSDGLCGGIGTPFTHPPTIDGMAADGSGVWPARHGAIRRQGVSGLGLGMASPRDVLRTKACARRWPRWLSGRRG